MKCSRVISYMICHTMTIVNSVYRFETKQLKYLILRCYLYTIQGKTLDIAIHIQWILAITSHVRKC